MTGTSEKALAGAGPGDFGTVAYRAATGTQLWAARYNAPGDSRVFVAGSIAGTTTHADYATIAYRG